MNRRTTNLVFVLILGLFSLSFASLTSAEDHLPDAESAPVTIQNRTQEEELMHQNAGGSLCIEEQAIERAHEWLTFDPNPNHFVARLMTQADLDDLMSAESESEEDLSDWLARPLWIVGAHADDLRIEDLNKSLGMGSLEEPNNLAIWGLFVAFDASNGKMTTAGSITLNGNDPEYGGMFSLEQLRTIESMEDLAICND